MEKKVMALVLIYFGMIGQTAAQMEKGVVVIRPKEITDVLNNPGIGFTTFQRFNGDKLNEGIRWTEGFPIEYQEFKGDLTNKNHPATSIAYWRVYWKFIEPEKGKFRWNLIDEALYTAEKRGQTLMLRIAPYGTGEERDVPDWYRKMVGDRKDWKYNSPVNKWQVDPEDPRYAEYFGGLIKALGEKYDGHPSLEGVDVSIVGAWGEGAGSELLSQKTREALIDAYTESFQKTSLIVLLMDEKTNQYARSKTNAGWRVDCIGDLGFWADEQNGWTHMYDFYPQSIIEYGVKDDWKKAPISLEICGTFGSWKEEQGYTKEDVAYIFEQTLKWHISSFNAKSSPVPEEWEPLVNDWLKKMGYRFVLRRFAYPETIKTNQKMVFESWWENKGVAPCYRHFPLVLRLKNNKQITTLLTNVDIRDWLPGDNVYNDAVFLPPDISPGEYELELALIEKLNVLGAPPKPMVKLAIEGQTPDGWYRLGKINVIK